MSSPAITRCRLLDIGDVVLSPMMGAYTTVTASRFNGIGATPVVVV